jgi:hypothetical protein
MQDFVQEQLDQGAGIAPFEYGIDYKPEMSESRCDYRKESLLFHRRAEEDECAKNASIKEEKRMIELIKKELSEMDAKRSNEGSPGLGRSKFLKKPTLKIRPKKSSGLTDDEQMPKTEDIASQEREHVSQMTQTPDVLSEDRNAPIQVKTEVKLCAHTVHVIRKFETNKLKRLRADFRQFMREGR